MFLYIFSRLILRKSLLSIDKPSNSFALRNQLTHQILTILKNRSFFSLLNVIRRVLKEGLHNYPMDFIKESVSLTLQSVLKHEEILKLIILTLLHKSFKFGILTLLTIPLRSLIFEILSLNIFGNSSTVGEVIKQIFNPLTLNWLEQLINILNTAKVIVEPIKEHWRLFIFLTSLGGLFSTGWYYLTSFPEAGAVKDFWNIVQGIGGLIYWTWQLIKDNIPYNWISSKWSSLTTWIFKK